MCGARRGAAPADSLREVLRPLPRLRAGVLGAHVARVEYAVAELARVGGEVVCVLW